MYTETQAFPMLGAGLLLARGVIGLVMAAHGAQKLFGWFGGYGLSGTGEFFAQLGFRPGKAFAAAAALAEITGGLLLALGFLGPVGPALVISVMVVAMVTVHWTHGLFASNNGIELPLLNIAVVLGLVFTGYGQYSVDAWLGTAGLWTPVATWVTLAVGLAGGITNLAIRRRPPATAGA